MSRRNEGPLFYRLAFWVVPVDGAYERRFGDEPINTMIGKVPSAEVAIRQARLMVQRLTREASPGQARLTGFGNAVDQPSTICVVSAEIATQSEWLRWLMDISSFVGPEEIPPKSRIRVDRLRRVRPDRPIRRIK